VDQHYIADSYFYTSLVLGDINFLALLGVLA
jgi:hypothetical protein